MVEARAETVAVRTCLYGGGVGGAYCPAILEQVLLVRVGIVASTKTAPDIEPAPEPFCVFRPDSNRFSPMESLAAFDEGRLDLDGAVQLAQYLLDSGLYLTLPGRYGRWVHDLWEEGLVGFRER